LHPSLSILPGFRREAGNHLLQMDNPLYTRHPFFIGLQCFLKTIMCRGVTRDIV
jgi:hypothetical protein